MTLGYRHDSVILNKKRPHVPFLEIALSLSPSLLLNTCALLRRLPLVCAHESIRRIAVPSTWRAWSKSKSIVKYCSVLTDSRGTALTCKQSYLVRWIHVSAGHTISWSIQPQKKSLNFGIFKHPGAGVTPNVPTLSTLDDNASLPVTSAAPDGSENASHSKTNLRRGSEASKDNAAVVEKLKSIGLKPVAWQGRCEADMVTTGHFDVAEGESGMYGLVFDNTFSKTVSKTAMFVLMTYPTGTALKSGNNLLPSQALARAPSTTSVTSKQSPSLKGIGDSTDSVHQVPSIGRPKLDNESRPQSGMSVPSSIYTGILLKKRRKRNQGWAKRFFSLDFTSSTLSYYYNRQSSALRGSVPLSLAAISTDAKRREISVDSGAEVWHLRASNAKDFSAWIEALNRAIHTAGEVSRTPTLVDKEGWSDPRNVDPAGEHEWARAEGLVGRVSGIRDAVRRLAKDTDPKYMPSIGGISMNRAANASSPGASDADSAEYFGESATAQAPEKLPFWKRRASKDPSPSALFRRSVSAQLAVPLPAGVPPLPSPPANGNLAVPQRQQQAVAEYTAHEEGVHDHCMAILRDLDQVVTDFSALLNQSKQRRAPALKRSQSTRSTGSAASEEEWFDANDGDTVRSQVLTVQHGSEDEEEEDHFEDASDAESVSSSEYSAPGRLNDRQPRAESEAGMFPTKAKSLIPLPIDPKVPRRKLVPLPKVQPPSTIGLLRKNVGKDLSTIAMPVSTNEPASAIQRVAEQLEYSELLDSAAVSESPSKRLLYISAFAISNFSGSRVKERALRKPFNPMLGETFEFVREDKGFRFVGEKVSHRPVRMASQAESEHWTFLQAPAPVTKFWGKSMEVNTVGRCRVFLHDQNEVYSWTIATSFLRNIIAGEKYIEPVQTMTIVEENTGAKAVCTFKAGGMFAGRSEDVTVQVTDAKGLTDTTGLIGKWTSHLNFTSHGADTGQPIWHVGALVDNAAQRYGFTQFAASLNEITPIENGHLPPTDSRLRPDQRAAENGELDTAEGLKARLEERQRARRKVMEDHGDQWKPRWFVKVGSVKGNEGEEEIWRLRTGKDGYWECRERGDWHDVVDVFAA